MTLSLATKLTEQDYATAFEIVLPNAVLATRNVVCNLWWHFDVWCIAAIDTVIPMCSFYPMRTCATGIKWLGWVSFSLYRACTCHCVQK